MTAAKRSVKIPLSKLEKFKTDLLIYSNSDFEHFIFSCGYTQQLSETSIEIFRGERAMEKFAKYI